MTNNAHMQWSWWAWLYVEVAMGMVLEAEESKVFTETAVKLMVVVP